jgi:hypothetical protein
VPAFRIRNRSDPHRHRRIGGDVRVTRSLDATNGLDAAAVAAVKQWKFKPGTKDGKPVRVMVTGMLTFSIRDVPPPMTLPTGFDPAAKSAVTEWVHASVPTDGVPHRDGIPRRVLENRGARVGDPAP